MSTSDEAVLTKKSFSTFLFAGIARRLLMSRLCGPLKKRVALPASVSPCGGATRDICDAGNVGPAFGAPEHATSNITEQAVIPMVKIGERFMFDFFRDSK
jgi:hypothetical protein